MSLNIKEVKNRAKITRLYLRDSYWEVDKVVKLLKRNKNKKKFFSVNKINIKTTSHKNNLFISNYNKWDNMCKCDICGLVGKYFALEKCDNNDTNVFHFNLYTIDSKTFKEVYFNIDHIHPRSKGGKNEMLNLQLTCENCNSEKGNNYEEVKHWFTMFKLRVNKFLNIKIFK